MKLRKTLFFVLLIKVKKLHILFIYFYFCFCNIIKLNFYKAFENRDLLNILQNDHEENDSSQKDFNKEIRKIIFKFYALGNNLLKDFFPNSDTFSIKKYFYAFEKDDIQENEELRNLKYLKLIFAIKEKVEEILKSLDEKDFLFNFLGFFF